MLKMFQSKPAATNIPSVENEKVLCAVENHYDTNSNEVLEIIAEMKYILHNHCGPFSKFAIIDNPFNEMVEPSFTKDGFNIMSALTVSNPRQKLIHKMVIYIGSKIAKQIGDGTTTGMLMTLNLLEEYIKDNRTSNLFNASPFIDIERYSNVIFSLISKKIDENKITIDKLEKSLGSTFSKTSLVKGIAYAQAFTSSHGDREIAEAISSMFAELPEESLNNLSFIRAGYETEKRISIVKEDDQYNCRSDILSTNMLNKDNMSRFYSENTIMDLYNPTLVIESPYTTELIKCIEEHYAKNENYVVLATGACTQTRLSLHSLYMRLRSQYPYEVPPASAILFVPIVETLINDVMILSLVGGIKHPSSEKINQLNGITVDFEKGQLKVSNLYSTVSHIHPNLKPMYKNLDYETYNNIFAHLEEKIDIMKAKVVDTHSNNDIREYIRLKNLLLLNKRVSVMIGGNSYDNAALFDVVEDCIHAVRKSLSKGFVPGGLLSTIKILQDIQSMFDIKNREGLADNYHNPVAYSFNGIVVKVFELEHIKTMVDWYLKAIVNTSNVFIEFDGIKHDYDYAISWDVVSQEAIYLYDPKIWNVDLLSSYLFVNVIIQPADTDITIFRRIEEVILRLVYSSDFIYKQRS